MADEVVASATSTMECGELTKVKMTIVGRPKRVVEQGDVVIVGLRSEKAPSATKALPQPAGSTDYACFIARKQWLAVATALARDQGDVLVLEGYPYLPGPVHLGL
jgi:hypothetical protein